MLYLYDGDILFSTDNDVLVKKHRVLPAIVCVQRNVQKVVIAEESLLKSNMGGMGNKVGSITNRATAMMEVISNFSSADAEYQILSTRILADQNFQQNEIDGHLFGQCKMR